MRSKGLSTGGRTLPQDRAIAPAESQLPNQQPHIRKAASTDKTISEFAAPDSPNLVLVRALWGLSSNWTKTIVKTKINI